MAMSSLSLNWVPPTFPKKSNVPQSNELARPNSLSLQNNSATCPKETISNEENNCKRRQLLLGVGALTANLLPAASLLAEEIPPNYSSFVDIPDGYSYYYPSDWREFDFRGHDSAFKDRFLQLQNVRVRFIPTDKKDIHDMGPINEVVYNLVNHYYAAPNQFVDILDMQERTTDGKNYYTFEYALASQNFASTSFTTIAIGNGRFYTLVVAALERRWKRVRNKLKVVADSFRVLDI
ncbi:Photosystem II PsbP, oxygen evolving complex [Corchorus capsularis]|uniref:Photosystem II PsbP, oxygen evolving complex n=1 Tax=Corchorus capsularis TaxID=210143 RepID=A0A1R3GL96_COCAP|nr:Photosystem II PsbP, oxygen evolving complex [Corchorus capsularis]